jgi:uncharacterized protein GlcG (DUF336 family)
MVTKAAAEETPNAPEGTAAWRRSLSLNFFAALALTLAALGRGLFWACALGLLALSLWLPLARFGLGLALIPLRRLPKREKGRPGKALPLALMAACLGAIVAVMVPASASAQNCPVSYDQFTKALKESVKASGGPGNGGFDNNEWGAVVTRDGTVCAVTFTGSKPDDQWLGSRAIAAEKANTANALSLKAMALSTANLYAGAQPGGALFGLVNTNPPDPSLITAGDPKTYGSQSDPLVGKHLGGVVVFGGGLALYDANGIVGALGVSGDTSCADHNIAWRVRKALGLDHVPNGVSPAHNDAIIYDMLPDKTSPSGFGHPQCGGSEAEVAQQLQSGFVPQWAQVMKK